jgi:hypothetical protein
LVNAGALRRLRLLADGGHSRRLRRGERRLGGGDLLLGDGVERVARLRALHRGHRRGVYELLEHSHLRRELGAGQRLALRDARRHRTRLGERVRGGAARRADHAPNPLRRALLGHHHEALGGVRVGEVRPAAELDGERLPVLVGGIRE